MRYATNHWIRQVGRPGRLCICAYSLPIRAASSNTSLTPVAVCALHSSSACGCALRAKLVIWGRIREAGEGAGGAVRTEAALARPSLRRSFLHDTRRNGASGSAWRTSGIHCAHELISSFFEKVQRADLLQYADEGGFATAVVAEEHDVLVGIGHDAVLWSRARARVPNAEVQASSVDLSVVRPRVVGARERVLQRDESAAGETRSAARRTSGKADVTNVSTSADLPVAASPTAARDALSSFVRTIEQYAPTRTCTV